MALKPSSFSLETHDARSAPYFISVPPSEFAFSSQIHIICYFTLLQEVTIIVDTLRTVKLPITETFS